MKKTKKQKSKSKKPAKKTAGSPKKSKVTAGKKKKSVAKKMKKVSLAELYKLKMQKQEQKQENTHSEKIIPPHELRDKVNLQQKSQGNVKIARSGAPGTRHN